jgi:hypothetical protein
MLHLFVPTAFFDDWGEDPSGWNRISELLAQLTVTAGLAALAVTIIRALAMLLFSEPISLSDGT